jgi:para-nitrobenzyl esterase
VTDMVGAQKAANVLREYPLAQYGSAAAAWATVTTDRVWSCTQVANDQQAARKVPVYAYEFSNQTLAALPARPRGRACCGVALSVQPRRLRVPSHGRSEAAVGADARLLDRLRAEREPERPGRPQWTPIDSNTVSGVSLVPSDQGGIEQVNLTSEHHCNFWASLT